MPAYDYRCTTCDRVFEVTRPVGGTHAEECPECGGPTKRIFSPVGVVFKGSGFHNTDYRPRPVDPAASPKPDSPGCDAKKDSPACSSCPASGE